MHNKKKKMSQYVTFEFPLITYNLYHPYIIEKRYTLNIPQERQENTESFCTRGTFTHTSNIFFGYSYVQTNNNYTFELLSRVPATNKPATITAFAYFAK